MSPRRVDLVLVSVFVVWGLLECAFVNPGGPLWARLLAAGRFALPLLWRREYPLWALAAIAVVVLVRSWTTNVADQGAMPFPALLAARSRRRCRCGACGSRCAGG